MTFTVFKEKLMQKSFKKSLCLVLCLAITLGLSACSGGASMSEENITATVETIEKALKNFDGITLQKYVKSDTLKTILTLSNSHSQFSDLGRAMFEKLEIQVKSIDRKNKTVTLLVTNRDMSQIAGTFAKQVLEGKSVFQLAGLLNNEQFLDTSLAKLTAEISEATVPDNPKEITVSIEKSKKNLILVFDEKAEDAVSGGVLTAIMNSITVS